MKGKNLWGMLLSLVSHLGLLVFGGLLLGREQALFILGWVMLIMGALGIIGWVLNLVEMLKR